MSKPKLKLFMLASCLGFMLSNTVQAQSQTDTSTTTSIVDTTSKDVFELSLEDLLNMPVTVSSKKEERVSDAPGMITSYTKQDVERYGYYTLKDLANITSGYSSFSAFGETNLETRGQKAGSWNVSKHLLLIDGIPVNHTRANSAPLEYQVPLYFADRVEFLKGPGSALYGTSAFFGVMNITSKNLKENGTLGEGKFTYGDAGLSKRIMGNIITKNDIGEMKISFSNFAKGFSGDSLGYTTGKKTFHYNNDNSTFLNTSYKFTNTKLKGISLGVIYMNRNSHAGEFWGATPSPNNEVTWTEFIPYIKYARAISKKTNFNSYLKYNASTEKSTFGASWASYGLGSTPFAGYSYTTDDVEALSEVSTDLGKVGSIIVGVNAYTRQESTNRNSFNWDITSTTDTNKTKNYSFNHTPQYAGVRVSVASAYIQYQKTFNVLKGLILTAGGRYDNGFSKVGKYSQLSPRAGLVLKATDKLNFKLLYGQALRVPGVKEIGLNSESITKVNNNGGNSSGISSPTAETIKTLEGGINYNTSNLSLGIVGFYNITKNSLDGYQYTYVDSKGVSQSVNYTKNLDGKIVAKGIEFDAQLALNKNVRFMLNHAIAKAVSNDTLNFVDVPTQKTNFASTYVLSGKFKLASTVVLRHVWGYTVTEGAYKDNSGNSLGTNLNGYTMMDLNFQIPVNNNFGFEFQVRNVLDTKWSQPSLLGQSSMIPLQSRNFMATLYVKL